MQAMLRRKTNDVWTPKCDENVGRGARLGAEKFERHWLARWQRSVEDETKKEVRNQYQRLEVAERSHVTPSERRSLEAEPSYSSEVGTWEAQKLVHASAARSRRGDGVHAP